MSLNELLRAFLDYVLIKPKNVEHEKTLQPFYIFHIFENIFINIVRFQIFLKVLQNLEQLVNFLLRTHFIVRKKIDKEVP